MDFLWFFRNSSNKSYNDTNDTNDNKNNQNYVTLKKDDLERSIIDEIFDDLNGNDNLDPTENKKSNNSQYFESLFVSQLNYDSPDFIINTYKKISKEIEIYNKSFESYEYPAHIVLINLYGRTNGKELNKNFFLALGILASGDDIIIRKQIFNLIEKLAQLNHLQLFLQYYKYCTQLLGKGMWGRMAKRAISNWIKNQIPLLLAESIILSRKNNGEWTFNDMLKCCHLNPKCLDPELQKILKYSVTGNYKKLKAVIK